MWMFAQTTDSSWLQTSDTGEPWRTTENHEPQNLRLLISVNQQIYSLTGNHQTCKWSWLICRHSAEVTGVTALRSSTFTFIGQCIVKNPPNNLTPGLLFPHCCERGPLEAEAYKTDPCSPALLPPPPALYKQDPCEWATLPPQLPRSGVLWDTVWHRVVWKS